MPGNYVTELASQAFLEISAGVGDEIERVIGTLPDAPSIANLLTSRPDLQAEVASLTGYTPGRWILECELDHVDARRRKLGIDPVPASGGPYKRAADSGLMGLCFSGGGIRSATFNLGVLQGLAELKLLRCFDYLSTVSGGGYIHQWFAAWSQRVGFEEVEEQLIPLPEPGNPGSHPEPLRWLRRYSNYLTPQKGLFTADTWVALAIWLRNTLLNQGILFAGLLFLALVLRGVTSHVLIPQNGPAVAALVGAIFFLSLMATCFVGKELLRLGEGASGESGAFGEQAVQRWLVLPMMISSWLLALLFPVISAETFGFNLVLTFTGSALLLLVLALTISFAGGAPLSYLKSHHRTSHYDHVADFWRQQPKCFFHLKFAGVILGLVAISVLSAVGGAAWIVGSLIFLARIWAVSGHYWWRIVLAIGPPLILGGTLIAMLLVVGLLGRSFQDARREWLSRLAAWMGLCLLLWAMLFALSLFGYYVDSWVRDAGHKALTGVLPVLWQHKWKIGSAIGAWLATSIGGLKAAQSAKSSGSNSDEAFQPGAIEVLAVVGPYVFIAGLLLLISVCAEIIFDKAAAAGILTLCAAYAVPLVICILLAWRVDINEFSLHAFYRNRLTRCYLGASNIPRHPNSFTGFDEADAKTAVSDLLPAKGYHGPFPIFCTSLNLTFGEDLAWQERKAASFVFTPLFSGYDVPWTASRGRANLRFNGFVRTENYAYPEPGIHINTAAAISGAAMSPNMGFHSSPPTAFLMTVFCVRLGWWLCNPRKLNEDGTSMDIPETYPPAAPHFSLLWLVNELLGRTNDTSSYVYLSDGGHFDNMGLYELVRRRCRHIVICDSEADAELKFEGIGMAIRKCRIDFGAEVDLDLRPLQHVEDSQNSAAHCVVGTVRYPEDPGTPGVVVYIKSSLTGDEPADVLNYKKQDAVFPHDSTTNQWFTESQFESYRRLGHHVAFSVFEPAFANVGDCVCATVAGRNQFFENLGSIWCPPTPEMEQFAAAHTERYWALMEKARTDENLPGFFDMMFSDDHDWKSGHSDDQIEYAVQFSFELIEFIHTVFNQLELRLPEKRNHPYAQGWSRIFTKWTKINVVQDGWNRYSNSYSPSFRLFAESDLVKLPRA